MCDAVHMKCLAPCLAEGMHSDVLLATVPVAEVI